MTNQIEIDVDAREGRGRDTRKSLSAMRAQMRIPGVIYGGRKPSVKVAISVKDLMLARKRGGMNAILSLKLKGSVETVMVKDIQRHPVTDAPIHADFQRISLTEKIEAKVPLQIIGEAPGVKTEGGMLQHELRVVSVRALPTAIPQHIAVDVSNLQMNQRIQVKDLRAPEGVELLDAPEHVVVHVTLVKEEVIEVAPAAGAAEGEAAEPEVIAKGKKPEEGEEGAEEEGKPGAKAPAAGAKAPAAGAKAPADAKGAPAAGKPGAAPGKPPAK